MSRVVIVEPGRLFRDSLVRSLQSKWPDRVIEGFAEISGVNPSAEDQGAELLLLSTSVIDRAALTMVRRGTSIIQNAHPVILLDQFDLGRAKDAIAIGVRGFVQKSAAMEVLAGALDMVLDGEVYFPSPASGETSADKTEPWHSRNRVRHISPRQQQVLELMVAGMSNADIAARLGIKESTVKNHVQGIFRTFNVGSRTQAVVAAVRAGLEPPPLPARHEFP